MLPSWVIADQLKAPQRVVSMNLCTDQLALLVAAPGQLISVSYLAAEASSSLMAKEAAQLHTNRGLAEQIIRLQPDLVLAGQYTSRASVNLLRRLGVNVQTFAPAYRFADIRAHLAKIGTLLGQEARANALIAQLDTALAEPSQHTNTLAPVLGSYGANSYTTGESSLESEVVKAAGFRHLGTELALQGASKLPLEQLIYASPDRLMTWKSWSQYTGRATEILLHPALDRWFAEERRVAVDSRYWMCGTPFTVEAINQLKTQMESHADHAD